MKRTLHRLMAFVAFLLTQSAALGAEEPSVVNTPVQGVVAHGRALAMYELGPGMFGGGVFGLRHAPLTGGPARDGCRPALGDALPRVWQVAHGYLWASDNSKILGGIGDVTDQLKRYRLDGFLEDKWITTAEVDEDNFHYGCFIGSDSPLFDTRLIHRVYYDYLPTAEDAVLLFLLYQVTSAANSELPGVEDGAHGGKATLPPKAPEPDDERKPPYWKLTVFTFKNKWDAKEGNWPRGKWERVGLIDVAFHEQFHVRAKGADYYFVTDSGKLYRSPPPRPERGKGRTMEAVWDDAKRPVAAFLTDADAERTFLFCKPDKEGKGVYFEMSDKPDLQPYDAGKVPEAKAADQLPAVLAYAKILLADKKIKDKP